MGRLGVYGLIWVVCREGCSGEYPGGAMEDPPEGGGNGGVGANGDAAMADGWQEARIGGHPADTGREKVTIRGALMVVGTMTEAQALAKQLGMADLKWRQAGEYVQRAEFDEWLHAVRSWSGPLLRRRPVSGSQQIRHVP